MIPSHVIGVLLALASALVWGSGDFGGGVATRRSQAFAVLVWVSLSGVVLLFAAALIRGEAAPSAACVAWAVAGGLSGALGIAALYKGLSLGNAAGVAPTSAVLGAVLPLVFAGATEGLPGAPQAVGLLMAIGGIWMVTGASSGKRRMNRAEMTMAVLAGFWFGLYFICIAQFEAGLVFGPLTIARLTSLTLALVAVGLRRERLFIRVAVPIALVAGVFDAAGNVFFLLARAYTRLDVAAVIASLYPATTVMLARAILKEPVTRLQWLGVAVCVAAVALIAW